jgi:hypothetical protein
VAGETIALLYELAREEDEVKLNMLQSLGVGELATCD